MGEWSWVIAAYLLVYGVVVGYTAVLHVRLRRAERRLGREEP